MTENIRFSDAKDVTIDSVLRLYSANRWSSAARPDVLHRALQASHSLVSAWFGKELVGLGSTLSDGHLVVYYSHLLVLPEYQRQGIGREIMRRLMSRYEGFHQQVLIADSRAQAFFRECGFYRAGETEPMWIFAGDEH